MAAHYTEEFKQKCRDMHASGATLREVSRECGASFTAVRNWCVPGAAEKGRLATAARRPAVAEKYRAYQKEWYEKNRERKLGKNKEWKAKNPIRFWCCSAIASSRCRARAAGIPFDLTIEDLMAEFPADMRCPVLGTEMVLQQGLGRRPEAPSLDKIRPSLGYVRGNVAIISNRANMIKSDATADEVLKVATWLAAITKET